MKILEGDPTELFRLAGLLADRLAVFPAPLSQAERGYSLFREAVAATVPATPIPLPGDPHLREATTLIGGWHGPRHHALMMAISGELKHLGKLCLPKLAA